MEPLSPAAIAQLAPDRGSRRREMEEGATPDRERQRLRRQVMAETADQDSVAGDTGQMKSGV